MEIIKTKIRNKKTGAITEVKSSLADDFIGTGEFELVEKEEEKPKKTFNTDSSNKE